MAKMRHWKQRFTPGAKMIFRKRLVINAAGVETVEPGDPVTDELRALLGHRLPRWWEAGLIELAEGRGSKAVEEKPKTVTASDEKAGVTRDEFNPPADTKTKDVETPPAAKKKAGRKKKPST